ncbi:unnamed protein product [Schistosoma turkestanicum]|nr:unnamed protein product [Schistosoma turkestanicum]
MDDVFDNEISDVHSELKVGSRDWERRAGEVYSAGIREGCFAKNDTILQKQFDIGIEQGFASTFELAVLRGRLSVRLYYSTGEEKSKIKNLVKSIDEKEKQLMSLGSVDKDITYQQLVREAEILLKS